MMTRFGLRIAVFVLVFPLAACASPGSAPTGMGPGSGSDGATKPSPGVNTPTSTVPAPAGQDTGDTATGVKARVLHLGEECSRTNGDGGCGSSNDHPLADLEPLCRDMAKAIPHFKAHLSESTVMPLQLKDGGPYFWPVDCWQHDPVVAGVDVLYDQYQDADAWRRGQEQMPVTPKYVEDGPYLFAIFNGAQLGPLVQVYTPNHGSIVVSYEWLGSWEKTNEAMMSVAKNAARFFGN